MKWLQNTVTSRHLSHPAARHLMLPTYGPISMQMSVDGLGLASSVSSQKFTGTPLHPQVCLPDPMLGLTMFISTPLDLFFPLQKASRICSLVSIASHGGLRSYCWQTLPLRPLRRPSSWVGYLGLGFLQLSLQIDGDNLSQTSGTT